MLQAIIDSFPSPDRSVLLLLYFDVISRKCKAVKKSHTIYLLPYEWWTNLEKYLPITSRKEGLTYHIFDSWTTITLDSDCLR